MSRKLLADGLSIASESDVSDFSNSAAGAPKIAASLLRLQRCLMALGFIGFGIFSAFPSGAQALLQKPVSLENRGAPLSLAEMQAVVAAASQHGAPWHGPTTGPEGTVGKTIALISEDLRNGGILGVSQGIQEAAMAMRWTVKVFDAGGTQEGRRKAIAEASAVLPDGIVLVGADAVELNSQLLRFSRKNIPIVGWHVGPQAGKLSGGPVAINVSTDPLEVARITALAAVVSADQKAGMVVFTDSNFAIALAKSNAMAEIIRACAACTLLEIQDVAISKSAERLPGLTQSLLARYGKRWTHALAINDIYFDYAVPELTRAGLGSSALNLLSAGDGSSASFLRIRARTFQTGTVAEPLNLHGWQLVDELNRLLAGEPVSGYVVPAHLVTRGNIAFDGGLHFRYDPDNGYRDIYRRIWKR